MRYAIFSDVHSNLEALEAVVQDMAKQEIDQYVCLGDIVGYAADPGPCLEIVRGLASVIILGNHDAAVAGTEDLDDYPERSRTGLVYSRDHVSEEQKDFLAGLPFQAKVGAASVVHSSFADPREWIYVLDILLAVANFREQATPIGFCGHTHIPAIFETKGPMCRAPRPGGRFEFNPKCQYLVNAGSVGQPRDGNPKACYAVYEEGKDAGSVEWRRVEYDFEITQKKIREAGLPELLASRLAQGR